MRKYRNKRVREGCRQTVAIYACAIHGECTLRWHGWRYIACEKCDRWETVN